jgi:hypothetical protein
MRLSSSFKKSAKERFGFVLLAMLIGTFAWLTHASASKFSEANSEVTVLGDRAPQTAKKDKGRPSCPHCAPAGNQEIYIPLIDLPEAQGSEIVFNSRSPQAMNVTPTFYKRDGTVVVGDPVTVQSAEIRYVDIRQLLPEHYRHQRDWGGFSLSYYGFNREMWSQFRFIGVNGGSNVDEFFTVRDESHSDELEAAWWMPKHSEAILALGNLTDNSTTATISFGDDHDRSVHLAPHATEILRYKSEKGERAESAVINVTGAAGSIVSTGVITSKDGTFNSVIRFYSPKLTKQSNLYANGFRVTGNTPHMVLKNTTSSSIAVVPKFIPLAGEGSSPFILSQVALAPNETTEVDLKPLLRAAKRRPDFDLVSVEVTNWAGPGSIIGSLYGINERTGVNYDIPLRDSGLVRTMTGSYPWKISDDFTTLVYITNISDQKAEFIGQINYDGGHFVIDPRKLAPGETAMFDLEKIRDDQAADNAGAKIPRGASIGQFKWAIHGVTNGKLLLIGRAEMVSRSQNISSSYSCNDPCPPYYFGWMDPLQPILIIYNHVNTSAWETATYDSGYSMGPYSVPASWSADSSAISVNPSGSHTTTVGAEEPGDGCVTADMGSQERYSWDGQNCYDNGFADPIGDTGCTEVAVNIRRMQYISATSGNQDISGTLYVLKGTAVTFNVLPDPPGATFPSSQPHWSGSSGISGTGQSKAVTFNTSSSSSTDFKTVTATAGNSVTANVIVYDLTGVFTPENNFPGRSHERFGIEESMSLSFTVTPSLSASQLGGLRWSITSSGSGNGTITASDEGTGTYVAPDAGKSISLALKVLDGPSKDGGPTVNIAIIEPSSGYASRDFSGIRHTVDTWSVGFLGDIHVGPSDVSFRNLFFYEGAAPVHLSGWLNTNQFNNPHAQSARSVAIDSRNVVSEQDEIWSGQREGPYGEGYWYWDIPWHIITNSGRNITFTTVREIATSDANGTAVISKGGPAVSRVPSNVTSFW